VLSLRNEEPHKIPEEPGTVVINAKQINKFEELLASGGKEAVYNAILISMADGI